MSASIDRMRGPYVPNLPPVPPGPPPRPPYLPGAPVGVQPYYPGPPVAPQPSYPGAPVAAQPYSPRATKQPTAAPGAIPPRPPWMPGAGPNDAAVPGPAARTSGVFGSLFDQVERLHPMSPNNRLPVPAAQQQAQRDSGTKNQGSVLVTAGMVAGLGLNVLQAVRVVAKVPDMRRMGTLSSLPDLLLTGPDRTILDPTIPRGVVAPSGMTYTKFDDLTLRGAAWFGPVMGVYQLGTGAWSVASTLRSGTPGDLVHTREGRSGLLQTAGGAYGLGVMGLALHQIKDLRMPVEGGGERALTAGEKVVAMAKAPASLDPRLIKLGIASGLVVALNQFGYFDVLNSDDDRGVGTKFHDAIHSTPVVNDPTLRPIVAAGLTGILGWKAAAHLKAAMPAAGEGVHGLEGLLSATRSVPLGLKIGIAGSVLVGGASLLGGLGWLDKPADPPAGTAA